MTERQTKFGRPDVNDAGANPNIVITGYQHLPSKGYVFSANGAIFTISLGRRPRKHGKKASALKARFTSETSLSGIRKSIEATEAPSALGVNRPRNLDLGALPQARR
jgi:hypothetical protein